MDLSIEQGYNDEGTAQSVYCSKKYSEKKTVIASHANDNFSTTYRSCKKDFGERNAKVDLFGDYAETDLDQPTDYSLRYAEDDTDDDEIQSPEYFKDTVKTYCTEGTPYETPLNFSTATSMSDLLLEDTKESVESQKKLNKKDDLELDRKGELNFEGTLPINCTEEALAAEKALENLKTPEEHKPNCLAKEKLLNYYKSGPNDYSHNDTTDSAKAPIPQSTNVTEITHKASSTNSVRKIENTLERTNCNVANSSSNALHITDESEGKSNSRIVDKEGKMVTFSRQDYYAEQTPLMFSRCSSLGSLSGFEQHSIYDDRSSIVSDFSRRTSGVVSPSELPDSPTQTIPPSPHNHKNQCADFISKISEEGVRPSVQNLSYSKCNPPRTSVFEDDIATFKEESTPIEFSTATSLSSLTIDDEMKIPNVQSIHNEPKVILRDIEKTIKVDSLEEKTNNTDGEKDQEQVSDGDEDDEDMLAACISMGIQNNRYRQSFKTSVIQKAILPEASNILVRCHRVSVLNRIEPSATTSSTTTETAATTSKPIKPAIEVAAAPDTVHVYCTEDTPADISPVGSQSNLSALSMPSVQEDSERIEEPKVTKDVECHRNDLSDESSNLSGEDEKILDECIQSGIPKVRQITPPPLSCMPFAQKTGALTQRFNVCGTPSSSPVEGGNKNSIIRKPMCQATLEHENDFSDDSHNNSDDEAILSEYIRSAIPKVRLNISTLISQSISDTSEKPKVANVRKPSLTIDSQSSGYLQNFKRQPTKPTTFEDNLSFSEEEEDIMLAQCIKSGMPKALNVSSNISLSSAKKSRQYSKLRNNVNNSYYKLDSIKNAVGQNHLAYKPLENYRSAHGGSSYNIHPVLTQENRRHIVKIGGINLHEKLNPLPSNVRKSSQQDNENSNVSENVSNGSRCEIPNCRSPDFNGTDNDDDEPCRSSVKSNVVPSRHSSVSSLSEEGSLGSIEEWALLELCISSGMPRNKYRLKGLKNSEANTHEERDAVNEENYSIRNYNTSACKT